MGDDYKVIVKRNCGAYYEKEAEFRGSMEMCVTGMVRKYIPRATLLHMPAADVLRMKVDEVEHGISGK
jgi:hypothetical protein